MNFEEAVEIAARAWWSCEVQDVPINNLTGKELRPWDDLHPTTRNSIREGVRQVLKDYSGDVKAAARRRWGRSRRELLTMGVEASKLPEFDELPSETQANYIRDVERIVKVFNNEL